MQEITLINLQKQINRLSKLSYKQILYSDGPLSGKAPCCKVLGIDNTTGDVYYKNDEGNWELINTGGAGLASIQEGSNITIDITDPSNPVISALSRVAQFDNISDISTASYALYDVVVVEDEVRGGSFLPYSGSLPVDNGVVFLDANSNKWKRVVDNNYINVRWYPVVENTAMDAIWAQIVTASLSKEVIPFPRIYFPSNTDNTSFYRFNSTITINNVVEIFGDGATSKLRWDTNVPGIVTNYITSRHTYLKNILLDGNSSATPSGSPLGSNWSTTQYGLEAKDIIHCEGVTFRYWASDGVHLYGDALSGSNVNNSTFTLCDASQNRRHGFFIQGPDANAMKFDKCDAISNGGAGFYDNSFLGNHYIHNHSASNGSPEVVWQRGLVKNGTDVYACIVDGTIGIEPGVTPGWESNWVLTGKAWSGFAPVKVYDAAVTYYVVCAYNLDGANQYGTFIGNYAESDQADSFIANRNVVIDVNFALRTGSASSIQSNGDLYSTDEFWAGNPGDFTTNRSFIAPRGVGVTKAGGTGLVLGWDSTRNVTEFKTLSGAEGTGNIRITTSATTAANAGRTASTVGALKPWFSNGILLNNYTNRTGSTKLLDASTVANPSTSNSDIGDLWLALTTTPNLSVPPETALLKYFYTTASSTPKLCPIKGYMEDTLTNVTGTFTIMTDYNIAVNRGTLYNIQFVGSNATDDCILHREILMVNRGGTVTQVNNTAIRADYIPGGFSGAAITLTVSGSDDIVLTITGLPAGTYGKVNVKRINY